jgi:hypothetical protein
MGSNGDTTAMSSLRQLQGHFGKARVNTRLMQEKLTAFEERLADLGTRIRPLQESTMSFSKAQQNISKTLAAISKTFDFYKIAEDTKTAVKRGYCSIRGDPQREILFWSSLDHLTEARAFLLSHTGDMKSANSALTTVNALLGMAVGELLRELERLLSPLGSCVALSSSSETLEVVVRNPALQYPSNVKDAQIIIEGLERQQASWSHLELFKMLRVTQVKRDLGDYDAASGPPLLPLDDVPYRVGDDAVGPSLRLALDFCADVLHGEAALWGSVLAPSPQGLAAFDSLCEAVLAHVQRRLSPLLETDAPPPYTSPDSLRQVNLLLSRLDALSAFEAAAEDLRNACAPDARRLSSSSAAAIVTALRGALVEACVESMGVVLASVSSNGPALQPLAAMSKKGASSSRNGGLLADQMLGCAGGIGAGEACELQPSTMHALHCCSQLLSRASGPYSVAVSLAAELDLLSGLPPDAAPSSGPAFSQKVLLSLVDALDRRAGLIQTALQSSLSLSLAPMGSRRRSRLEVLMDKHSLFELGDREAEAVLASGMCRPVFLLNNTHAVLEHLESGGAIEKGGGAVAERLRAQLQRAVEDCCSAAATACALTQTDQAEFHSLLQTHSHHRDRLLKAKWFLATSGLDALFSAQGEFRLAAPKLRAVLGARLEAAVAQPYASLFRDTAHVPFTRKHKEQYIKYRVEDVQYALSTYFG